MKKWLALSLTLFAAGALSAAPLNPTDKFLEAFFYLQDGDTAAQEGQYAAAIGKYRNALAILEEIAAATPDWNAHIIAWRTRYCNERIAKLQAQLIASLPAPPAVPPVALAPATNIPVITPSSVPAPLTVLSTSPIPPAPHTNSLANITAELQHAREVIFALQRERNLLQQQAAAHQAAGSNIITQLRALQVAHDALQVQLRETQAKALAAEDRAARLGAAEEKIRQLETERADLTARLQATVKAAAANDQRAALDEMLQRNAALTAELAALRETLLTNRLEQTQLRAKLETASTQLQKLRQEFTVARAEMDTLREQNVAWQRAYAEATAKLAEAERQWRAAKLAHETGDQIIMQLAREKAALQEAISTNAPAQPAAPTKTMARPPTLQPVARATPLERPEQREIPELRRPGSSRNVVGNWRPSRPAAITAPSNTLVATIQAPVALAAPATNAAPVISSPPPTVALGLRRATKALNDGDLARAIADYEAVLKEDPTNTLALSNLGIIRYQQDRLDDAEALLHRAIAAAPNDGPARAALGIVHLRKGRLDDAFGELTRAVALDPRHAEAHNYLGITLDQKGWSAAAEKEIRRALELDPQYADAHVNLAILYMKQKPSRVELARHHYLKARELGVPPDESLETALKLKQALTK